MPSKPFKGEIKLNDHGEAICSSRLITLEGEPQRFCPDTALYPNGRCRLHGGATPRGDEHWKVKSGKWVPYLSGENQKKYLDLQMDNGGDPLSLEDEINLIDSFMATAIANIEEGGSAKILVEISEAFEALEDAESIGDAMTADRAKQRLARAIDRGKREGEARQEIASFIETRIRLTAAEAKRLKENGKYLEMRKVVLIMTKLANAIYQNVKDVELRRTIIAEFRSIAAGNVGGSDSLLGAGKAD